MAVNQTPLARITNQTWFCNRLFAVLPRVFIPRPETELVVTVAVELIRRLHLETASYVDLCCGCGVIGLSVCLAVPGLNGTCVDLSPEAVANTLTNRDRLGLTDVAVIARDWRAALAQADFQVITANFPYVGYADPIDEHLIENEPALALFANDGGWEHYETLVNYLKTAPTGRLVVVETSALHAAN